MGKHVMPLPDLVISSGQTVSNVLTARGAPTAPNMATTGDGYRDSDFITIHAPDTLPEAVVVNVSDRSGGNFNPLQRNAVDVAVPAGKSITVDGISFEQLELVAGGAVAATRTFKVEKGVWV